MPATLSTFNPTSIKYRWARKELLFDQTLERNRRGKKVKIVQEWLSLHGFGLEIDGDFGPATERAVRQFQELNDQPSTGRVDDETFFHLTAPIFRALTPIQSTGASLSELVVAYARQHLAEHPLEIGGQNRGPWVRLYMQGNDGTPWAWCAGFVCFLLRQAADTLGQKSPIKTTFSCDVLAERARDSGRFVPEKLVQMNNMEPGAIFLVRRTSIDWLHTGIVIGFHEDVFETIEGNTNDEGSREGYEVCHRFRAYGKKDFVRMD